MEIPDPTPSSQLRLTLTATGAGEAAILASEHDLDPRYVDVCACLAQSMAFTEGAFGLRVVGPDAQEIMALERPNPGERLVSSNQQYLEIVRINTVPGATYTIEAWARNAGELFEIQHQYTAPEGSQP